MYANGNAAKVKSLDRAFLTEDDVNRKKGDIVGLSSCGPMSYIKRVRASSRDSHRGSQARGECPRGSQRGGQLAIPKMNSDYAIVNERLVAVART